MDEILKEEDLKEVFNNLNYIPSSESDSDFEQTKYEFDSLYKKVKPPAIKIDSWKDKIIVLKDSENSCNVEEVPQNPQTSSNSEILRTFLETKTKGAAQQLVMQSATHHASVTISMEKLVDNRKLEGKNTQNKKRRKRKRKSDTFPTSSTTANDNSCNNIYNILKYYDTNENDTNKFPLLEENINKKISENTFAQEKILKNTQKICISQINIMEELNNHCYAYGGSDLDSFIRFKEIYLNGGSGIFMSEEDVRNKEYRNKTHSGWFLSCENSNTSYNVNNSSHYLKYLHQNNFEFLDSGYLQFHKAVDIFQYFLKKLILLGMTRNHYFTKVEIRNLKCVSDINWKIAVLCDDILSNIFELQNMLKMNITTLNENQMVIISVKKCIYDFRKIITRVKEICQNFKMQKVVPSCGHQCDEFLVVYKHLFQLTEIFLENVTTNFVSFMGSVLKNVENVKNSVFGEDFFRENMFLLECLVNKDPQNFENKITSRYIKYYKFIERLENQRAIAAMIKQCSINCTGNKILRIMSGSIIHGEDEPYVTNKVNSNISKLTANSEFNPVQIQSQTRLYTAIIEDLTYDRKYFYDSCDTYNSSAWYKFKNAYLNGNLVVGVSDEEKNIKVTPLSQLNQQIGDYFNEICNYYFSDLKKQLNSLF